MGSYTQVITNAGEELIAQALEGETLIFTEVATSASIIEGTLEKIKAVSELQDIKQTVVPAAATKIGSSTVQVSSSFTNEGIDEAYDVQTVGLYAKIGDNEQKLFAIAKALKASEMPEQNVSSAVSIVFNFNMTIQQASELTISIIPGGALPSEVFYSIFPGLGAPSLDNAKNILQVNAKGTWEYITSEDMKASTDEFGFVKLCDSSAVTDSTGLALPVTEKNASIEGTLAYQLSQLNTDCKNKQDIVPSVREYIKDFRCTQTGWYRIAKFNSDILFGVSAIFEIKITSRYQSKGNCVHDIKFVCPYNRSKFILVSGYASSTYLTISKIRYVKNNSGENGYLEVYYKTEQTIINPFYVYIKSINYTDINMIDPVLTEETVDGYTVVSSAELTSDY